jgi:GAF domain-containing protein
MAINTTAVVQRENARLKAENQALQDELRDLREFVKVLNELIAASQKITSDAELLPLLKNILSKALNLLNAPDGSLMLCDDATNELVFMIVHGTLSQDLSGYRIPADAGVAGWVVKNAQPALIRDVRRDTRFSHMIDDEFKFKTQSIAAAPLIGDQQVYGVVEVLNKPGDDPFSETDLALLNLLCRMAGEALADIERGHPEAN